LATTQSTFLHESTSQDKTRSRFPALGLLSVNLIKRKLQLKARLQVVVNARFTGIFHVVC
jgi:hypothetical protein